MTGIRNIVAIRIREFDPDNTLPAGELGKSLGIVLAPWFTDLYADDIIRFVEQVNPGKTFGAGALADALVDHFRLDQEI